MLLALGQPCCWHEQFVADVAIENSSQPDHELTRGCFALLVCWSCPCSLLWLCLLPFLGAGLHGKHTALEMAGRMSHRGSTAYIGRHLALAISDMPAVFQECICGTVNNMCSPIAASRGPYEHSRLGWPGEGDVAWTRLANLLLTFSASQSKPAINPFMLPFILEGDPSKSSAMHLKVVYSVTVVRDGTRSCLRTSWQ